MNKILKRKNNRAFTLVELMVTISIFLILSSIVIFDYSSFRSQVSLQNLTDNIALSIRKAQSFAIGARRAVGQSVVSPFNNSYGIHFSTEGSTPGSLSGSRKSFLLFSVPSTSTKKSYSTSEVCGTTGNQCLELFDISHADMIESITAIGFGGTITSLDIVFTRPNPRAEFYVNKGTSAMSSVTSASIKVSNGLGSTDSKYKFKTITVQNTGQISIQ